MEFEGRPGVCGNGRDVVAWGHTYFARNMTSIGGRWNDSHCVPGPLRVSLWTADRQPTRLETQVGGAWPSTGERVTDLGVVDSREASQYIFSLVPRLEQGSGKDRLLVPAVLAADAEVVKPLLALARDEDRRLETRRSAVMWLGLAGDATVVPVLAQFARQDVDADGDDKPGRKSLGSAAMAALANVDDNAGVPALIELAHGGSVGTRRNAVFWLGQNGDPRGIRTLREVIENSAEDMRVREHAIFSLSQSHDASDKDREYLRGMYPRLGPDKLKEQVLQGQMQDESDSAGRWLIAHALNEAEPVRLRRTALFWAGQREATPTSELIRVYKSASPEQLREHAIFVLSQRQDDEATDALLEIARQDRDQEMRRKALFWLAQKHDPRVQKLISDIILK